MLPQRKRISVASGFINYYQNQKFSFGWTEKGVHLKDLGNFLRTNSILELKQIHSNIVLMSKSTAPFEEGDGIILNETEKVALIRTADCIPLFFWHNSFTCAGIIHIGWRGLQQRIQLNLVDKLRDLSINLNQCSFYIGPGIEKKCYEVSIELYESFALVPNRGIFFSPISPNKFLLDLKKGIILSLLAAGVNEHNIGNANTCTYCNLHLPSYRREKQTEERIYNFLVIKK